MLVLLDLFYTLLHFLIIGFNLFGWIWKRTRKLHLISLGITAASWFILGIWYGWGYCPVTDWHWDIKEKLGEKNLPSSFIKYFADKLTGTSVNPSLIEGITVGCLIAAIIISLWVNFRSQKKPKQAW